METRRAPTIVLLMLSLFETTSRGTDPLDRLKFKLGGGYQVIAHGAIGRLERLNLLIDTGSFPSMVDGRIAEKLRVDITETESTVFDRKIPVLSATLSDVRVGPIVVDTVLASVGDLSYLGDAHVDAIIGLDVLTRRSFSIDYDHRILTFGTIPAGDPSVHLDIVLPFLTVQVSCGGYRFRLLVDTGSRHLVLFEQRVRDRASYVRVPGDKLLYHMAGTSRLQRVLLPHLEVGSLTRPQIDGLLSDADVHHYPPDIDGILGVRAIVSNRVDFDFERNRLGLH